VVGQILVKYGMMRVGAVPAGPRSGRILPERVTNGHVSWAWRGRSEGVCWMAAVSKMDLSLAYPLMSGIVLGAGASGVLFGERVRGRDG